MVETQNPPAEETNSKSKALKAPKNRNCKYCGEAFTSSSLGRHLDRFYKGKNPKPPDGIHDIEEIRKNRKNITRRRHPKSLSWQNTSASVDTPRAAAAGLSSVSGDGESPSIFTSPVSVKEVGDRPTAGRNFPFNTPWEATGVINGIPLGDGDPDSSNRGERRQSLQRAPPTPHHARSREALKLNRTIREETQEANDAAKAARLALRELLGSIRAAKQQIDVDSMPFDFDPLSLDFPTLALHCLAAPPTLFASIQTLGPDSWSISPPGSKEHEALKRYFEQEFRKWKITCTAATTAVNEELTYPPRDTLFKPDTKEEVRKAEKAAERLEEQVSQHLEAAYDQWNHIPESQREYIWKLELARSAERKQKQLDKLKETEEALRQENAHLKSQVGEYSRLQRPREFHLAQPTPIFWGPKLLNYMFEEGVVHNKTGVGFDLADRHSDIDTVVSTVIDRWSKVIEADRSTKTGLQNQRPLSKVNTEQSEYRTAAGTTATGSTVQAQAQAAQLQKHQPRQEPQQTIQNTSQTYQGTTSSTHATGLTLSAPSLGVVNAPTGGQPLTRNRPTNVPVETEAEAEAGADEDEDDDDDDDEDMTDGDADADGDEYDDTDADADSDADADAEMDEDNTYNTIRTPPIPGPHQHPAPSPHQQSNQLGIQIPRTRTSDGTTAHYNPMQNNNNAANRSVTHAGGASSAGVGHPSHAAPGSRGNINSNNMHLLMNNRSVSGNNNTMAGAMRNLGGQQHQFLNNSNHNNNMVGGGMAHGQAGRLGLVMGDIGGGTRLAQGGGVPQEMGIPSQGQGGREMYTG